MAWSKVIRKSCGSCRHKETAAGTYYEGDYWDGVCPWKTYSPVRDDDAGCGHWGGGKHGVVEMG